MTSTPRLEIRARPSARSLRTRLAGPAAMVLGGLALLAGVLARAVDAGARPTITFMGLVLVASGVAIGLQQRRLLWAGAIVRLDAHGVHVRRPQGFVSLSWDRVAAVRLLSGVLRGSQGELRPVVALSWIPSDDRDVPDLPHHPVEKLFPLNPAHAHLATLFNGRDRSDELRALLDVVRRDQPQVEVLDTVLGTTPEPEPPTGDEVLVLVSAGAWGLEPHLVAGLRSAGRTPVLVADRDDPYAEHLERRARVLGAQVCWLDDHGGAASVEVLRAALSRVTGLVVVTPEPGQGRTAVLRPLVLDDLRGALTDRPAVVVVRDPADLAAQVTKWAEWAGAVTVMSAELLDETPPAGTITLARARPSGPSPLAARDLVTAAIALLDEPVVGVVHASGGPTPILDAVAGCAE